MNIYIPSYKRANGLLGKDYFRTAKYVIPISQKKDYLKVLTEDRIITIPDSEDGNIGRKRNWILRNLPRPLVMIDDDVYDIRIIQGRRHKDEFQYFRLMDFDLFDEYMDSIIPICEDLNVHFFGLAQKKDEREYKEFQPFNLSNIILGPVQGHLDHPLFFDEKVGTKDDYDMSLQQLHRYKKVLRINFMCYHKFSTTNGSNEGGGTGMRSVEKEITNCIAIMQKWGTDVIRYRIPPIARTDLLNAWHVNVPIKGI